MADCAAVKAQLCKTNLMRQGGAAAKAILDACRTAGIEVERRDCLDLCRRCEHGAVARLDGVPVEAESLAALAAQLLEAKP